MDEFMTKLTEYMTAMEGLVKEYAPDAVNLGLNVARVHALQVVLIGLGSLGLVVWGILGWRGLSRKGCKIFTNMAEATMAEVSSVVFYTTLIAIPVVPGTIANVWNLWAWVGIFVPEVYLAFGVVDKFM